MLYKNAFCESPKCFYIKNYGMMAAFATMLVIINCFTQNAENDFVNLILNGCISLVGSVVLCVFAILLNNRAAKRLINIIGKG